MERGPGRAQEKTKIRSFSGIEKGITSWFLSSELLGKRKTRDSPGPLRRRYCLGQKRKQKERKNKTKENKRKEKKRKEKGNSREICFDNDPEF